MQQKNNCNAQTHRMVVFIDSTCLSDPNKPGELKEVSKSTGSLLLHWAEAPNMTSGSFNYSLTYWPYLNSNQFSTRNNTFLLNNLQSGTSYNVSVATVGPMGFKSESVFRYPVTTSKFSS